MGRGRLGLVLALVVLSGCAAGPGDRTPQPIEASASEATVPGDALSGTGFSESRVEQVRVNRSGTLSISGDVEMDLGYRVRATGWRAQYRAEDGTVLGVYTVPMAEPDRVDARIDPLGDRSRTEIVSGAQTTYVDLADLEHVRNRTVTILDTETPVQEFAGTARTDEGSTEVTVHVATVDHGSDRIRAVAVTPRETDSWDAVRTLLASISH